MEYKDALTMFFERSEAMQTFWNFHITVILGLIAFFASVPVTPRLPVVRNFIMVVFLAFVVVNCGALINVTQQRLRLVEYCDTLANNAKAANAQAASAKIAPSAEGGSAKDAAAKSADGKDADAKEGPLEILALSGKMRDSLQPPQIWHVCVLHGLADIMTLVAIYMLTSKKQREAAKVTAKTA